MESHRRTTQMVRMNVANISTKEVHEDRTAEAGDESIGTVARGEANATMKHATTPQPSASTRRCCRCIWAQEPAFETRQQIEEGTSVGGADVTEQRR